MILVLNSGRQLTLNFLGKPFTQKWKIKLSMRKNLRENIMIKIKKVDLLLAHIVKG